MALTLEQLEALTLAEDRDAGLDKLIPGTPEYYFHRGLAHQLHGELDEAAALLTAWRKREGRSSGNAKLQQLENRQLLLSYSSASSASARARDELRQRLDLSFDHQRELEAERRELPTRLAPAIVDHAGFLAAIADRPAREYIAQFSHAGLPYLCGLDTLDDAQLEALLRRLDRPDYPRVLELVSRELRQRHSKGFGALPLHRTLTTAQLDQLLALHPELRDDSNFIEQRLAHFAPGPELDLRRDPAAMRAHLERLWAFVEPLSEGFTDLKVHVLYHRLEFDRRAGDYSAARLERYLQLPRESSLLAPDYRERHAKRLASFGRSFESVTGLATVHNDSELVRAYLLELFASGAVARHEPYEAYLASRWLRQVYAEAKILAAGEGDRERWFSLLDDAKHYAKLEARVDLELALDNPLELGAEDPVELAVYVKNVSTLVVKVFEINVEAYFTAHGKAIQPNIDLDGLVAANERSLEYSSPPLQRVRRVLAFPELARAGTFVVELIGGGRSCRALLRKGQLDYLERITSAGHALTIIDESGDPRPEATLLMGGRVYAADEGGELRVPFRVGGSSPSHNKGLLRCGGRASVVELRPQAESYTLDASFHVPREQLIAGAEATLSIRAALRVAGVLVSPSLLDELNLTLTATTRQGHDTSIEQPLSLSEAAEATVEFKVPEQLQSLRFELSGKLRQVSLQRDVSVSSSGALSINQIDSTSAIAALHLTRTATGYKLRALGKSGEARANLQVNFSLAHREFTPRLELSLRTDASGCIALGALPGISDLRASLSGGEGTGTWVLPRARARLPKLLHLAAGDHMSLTLPYESEQHASLPSLLERRRGGFVRDCRARLRVSPGCLHITGLEPGDYVLSFADGHQIELRVGGPERVPGWALSSARRLQLRELSIPTITSIERDEQAGCLRVQVVNHDPGARVHVFASAMLPPRTAYAALAHAHEPQLQLQLGALAYRPNVFLSGRDIGEEYRYILERRHAERFAGSMLERPSLLLNPWALRKTSSSKREATGGQSYDGYAEESAAPAMARPSPKRALAHIQNTSPGVNLDFLPRPGFAAYNLEPDERGVVELPLAELAGQAFVEVIVANSEAMSSRHLALPEAAFEPKDLRLSAGLDPARHIIKRKRFEGLASDEVLVLEDRRTAQFELVDSIAKARTLLLSLSANTHLSTFEFIARWPSLSPARQRELYSKYACHELNLFLARKDGEFFAQVIRPYLANKRARTFIDRYLLGEALDAYLEPWAYGRLNALERCLLAARVASEAQACKRHLSDHVELLPPDPAGHDRLFDTALQGSALAVGGSTGAMFLDDDADADEGEDMFGQASFGGGGPPPPPAQAPRAPGAPPPAPRARKAKKGRGGSTGARSRRDERAREVAAPRYRPGDKTSEWAETHYYQLRLEAQGPELIEPNPFWRDYAAHLADEATRERPFLSGNFMHATKNFAELMGALALLDLPFEASAPQPSVEGARARLRASTPLIAYHAQLSPVDAPEARAELLVSQDYFRADDRHEWIDGRQREKYVRGEFLVHTVYCCRVIVTNTSAIDQQLALLLQIPRGALPVSDGYETRDLALHVDAHGIESFEYAFYFPAPGRFEHYPVHVSSEGQLVAHAEARALEVVAELSVVDTRSWSHVSQQGSQVELLDYLETHNIERVELERIAWRMRERETYAAVLALLRRRHHYSEVLWAYAVHHGDVPAIGELLRHRQPFLASCGWALDSELVSFNSEIRGWYEHLEYAPLVHARAHVLGARREIQNEALAAQYRRFLEQLLYTAHANAEQLLSATYYMLVQDRVGEAITLLARAEALLQSGQASLSAALQYDYLRAYLALVSGDIDEAQRRAAPHREYPVDRWRKRFGAVLDVLEELAGAGAAIADTDSREQVQAHHAAQTPSLELELRGETLVIAYQHLEACSVNYYRMDLELLFSRQPFMRDPSQRFAVVQPNASETLPLPREQRELEHPLPPDLRRSNAMIEVVGGGLRQAKTSFAHDLHLRVSEAYGQLRVYSRGGRAPLPKTYVKVYARQRNGKVAFYKDGYTDLRGAFDYATVSTAYEGDESVERYAILVMSEEHGALVREVTPPS